MRQLVRALAVVLVALVGAGSTLLDSCVLGCHPHAHTQAQAPEPEQHSARCHQGMASSDQSQWQATTTCSHDHGELSADVDSQPRPNTGPRTVSLAAALRPAAPTNDETLVSLTIDGAEIILPFQSSAFLSPLRL